MSNGICVFRDNTQAKKIVYETKEYYTSCLKDCSVYDKKNVDTLS